MNPDPRAQAQLKLWWIVWGATLPWVLFAQFLFQHGPVDPALKVSELLWQLIGVVPIFLSIVIRWLVLPRFTSLPGAFPMFLAGLVLAELGGILGIFMGGFFRDAIVVLSLLGLLQFAPFFARRLADPRPQGYIPNN